MSIVGVSLELMSLCDKGASMDAETALGFRAWVSHLSDPNDQNHARLYLDLVQTNSPIMAHGIGELIKLFKPDNNSWVELQSIKGIFDQVSLDAVLD